MKGSRLCRCHLDEKGFVIEKDLNLVQSIDGEVSFDENSINKLIVMYKQSKTSSQIFSQYDSTSPIQDDSLQMIGFTKHEFLYLVQYLDSQINVSKKRTKEQALFVYLLWLRTGLTIMVSQIFSCKI